MNTAQNHIEEIGKDKAFEAADHCMADVGVKTEELVSVVGRGDQVVVRALVQIERTFTLDQLKDNEVEI